MQEQFEFDDVDPDRVRVLRALAGIHRDDFAHLCRVMRAHLWQAQARAGLFGERARELAIHLTTAAQLPPVAPPREPLTSA